MNPDPTARDRRDAIRLHAARPHAMRPHALQPGAAWPDDPTPIPRRTSPRWRPMVWIMATLLLASVGSAVPADPLEQVRGLPGASLLVQDLGRDHVAWRAETPRVPASTMKLLTAYAALETWGRGHRFATDFHLDDAGWLWVRGYADPYLVSEELDRVASGLSRALRARRSGPLEGIGLDDSYFGPDLEIRGRGGSDNPYDAPVTALAANFNTISVEHSGGQVRSAEPQTPLTATARRLGAASGPGRQRINLGERETALRYFGELLAAKLGQAGVAVGPEQRLGRVPSGAQRVYRHSGSRSLEAIVAPMLEYSNNFIANALFLGLGASDRPGGGVRPVDAQRWMTDFASRRFGWSDFVIDDGAGLSRANRLSARQLVQLLEAFRPYLDLMPRQDGTQEVRAKTGTLRGVSSYAGYVRRDGGWSAFALLINEPVDYNLRLRVASSLAR